MKRRDFLITLAGSCTAAGLPGNAVFGQEPARAELKGKRPNIVLIMPDDITYGSIHAYGSKNKTPNLDALYNKGVRFENFHVSPTCAPTRAAIMTGRHEFYAGVTHTIHMRERMSLTSRTVAEMLRDSGYATGIFGKWHLGDAKEYRPGSRGFSETYIHGGGGIGQNYSHSADFPNNDYNNPTLFHNGKVIETNGYCTDLFFDQAIKWMGEQKQANNPFFVYTPTNVNHSPKIPPILPDGSAGDIMQNLDDNVGKMMKYLDDAGLSESTLLIYTTDNGSPRKGSGKSGKNLRGGKADVYEGGIRVPCLLYWKGRVEGGKECHKLTGHLDFYATFAELAGSDESAPGGKKWDGRSMVPLLENPDADWAPRYWIAHRGRWSDAASSKYSHCSIQHNQYKLVMDDEQTELFDLHGDLSETTNIAAEHPDIVEELRKVYDSWWEEVQTCFVNDNLEDVPKTHKPFHELYRKAFGDEKFQQAMKLMTWDGGKPGGPKKKKKATK